MNDFDEFRRELSARTFGALRYENLRTWDEIAKRRELEMLRIPNFGRKSLRELKQALHARGLDFAGNYEAPRKVLAQKPNIQAALVAAWDSLDRSERDIKLAKRRIEALLPRSHNATPEQPQLALPAQKPTETDHNDA